MDLSKIPPDLQDPRFSVLYAITPMGRDFEGPAGSHALGNVLTGDKFEIYGTGFIINVKDDHFLVTCAHVIDDMYSNYMGTGTRPAVQLHVADDPGHLWQPQSEERHIFMFPDNPEIWKTDELLDLATIPLGWVLEQLPQDAFFVWFGLEDLLGSDEEKLIPVGDVVRFYGYSGGHRDRAYNIPLVRSGTIASPIHFDFEGRPEFLVDASVWQGNSGSPVMYWGAPEIPQPKCLGMIMEGLTTSDELHIHDAEGRHQTARSTQHIDLAVVRKARELRSFLLRVYDELASGAGESRSPS